MTWPIVDGVSLMHLHINRGKRSMERRGLGYDDLKAINPKIVYCTISGYGMTGPYKEIPSHGVGYDDDRITALREGGAIA